MPQRTLLATRDRSHRRDWLHPSPKRQAANALWSLSARAVLIAIALAAIVGVLSKNDEPSLSDGLPAASAVLAIKSGGDEPMPGSTAIETVDSSPVSPFPQTRAQTRSAPPQATSLVPFSQEPMAPSTIGSERQPPPPSHSGAVAEPAAVETAIPLPPRRPKEVAAKSVDQVVYDPFAPVPPPGPER
jgi:hypothetical protein